MTKEAMRELAAELEACRAQIRDERSLHASHMETYKRAAACNIAVANQRAEQVRAETIELCARVCETRASEWSSDDPIDLERQWEARGCAQAIRSLSAGKNAESGQEGHAQARRPRVMPPSGASLEASARPSAPLIEALDRAITSYGNTLHGLPLDKLRAALISANPPSAVK